MDNVKIDLSKSGKLIIEMDLAQDFGLSASGKTHIVASTHGFQKLETTQGPMSLSINLVKKGAK